MSKLKNIFTNLLKKTDKITFKLVPTYFLVMVLTLVLFSYYMLGSMRTYMYNEEKISSTAMANIVASFATNYIDALNSDASDDFDSFVKSLNIIPQMRVLVVNKDSVVVYDNLDTRSLLGKVQIKQSVISSLGGENGFETYKNSNGVTVLDISVPILENNNILGAVNIIYTADNVNNFISAMYGDLLLMGIVIVLLVGLIIFLVSALMTKRIVEFTDKIVSMSTDGILDEQLEIKGYDEIARLGEAFNTMSEKVQNLEQKRAEFVSNASHELKTPLSSIKLMADSIIQTPDIDTDMVREFLFDMNNEIDRLNRIVTKLLYITKMDTNSEKVEINMELVSVRDILNGIEKSLMPIAQRDEISLEFIAHQDIYIKAHKDTLWQGIYNIVDNAIKYSKEFGEVKVELTYDLTDVIITVKDNGVGISEDNISKIFNRFYRVDKARSRETGGTGLGLSIALSAIKIHGGDIIVESEPNIGSTFIIKLPLLADFKVDDAENNNDLSEE